MATTRQQQGELVLHLTAHELSSAHRFSVLGWAWPLIRQLAQLGVLVFLFSHIVDLGLANYAVFVFSGLISWTWFATSVETASTALIGNRHLVLQPRFPPAVLPVVSVALGFVDSLIALPILVGMTVASGDISWKIAFLPVLFAIQFALTCGIALIASVLTVYLRDVRGLIAVGLTLLFYLTPVFYDAHRVSSRFESVLRINPLTTLLQGYRALLLGSGFPPAGAIAWLIGATLLFFVAGTFTFRRLSGGIVDEL